MPEVTGTVLQARHAHPRDARIQFKDEGHVYTVDGVPGQYTSVTTLVHQFFPHFDADAVIPKIIANPRSAYFGMTKDDVQKQWDHATHLGSCLHAQIECFFDEWAMHGVVPCVVAPSVEFGFFLEFFRDRVVDRLRPYRSEWYVFHEEHRVCGSIDMLFADPEDLDRLYIVDWKRSKEIRKGNRFEKGLKCLSHLDNCNFSHYSLQLNLYKYILESKYGKTVEGMMLVVLHPNNQHYQAIDVPDMQADVVRMLATKDVKEDHPSITGDVARYLRAA